MLSEDELAFLHMWSVTGDVTATQKIVDEVRFLRSELQSARKHAKAWKALAKMFVRRCALFSAIDDGNKDILRRRVENLQGAINSFCEMRNRYRIEDHTPYGEAIDELYRISRESGLRPRYIAGHAYEPSDSDWTTRSAGDCCHCGRSEVDHG